MRNLAEFLRTQARAHPDQPLVRWKDESVTFKEFDERTDRIAAGLAAKGVEHGDVVSVMLPNQLAFLEAWWGILKAGGVFGPVNPQFTGPEAGYVIGHSKAVAVVTDERGAGILEGVRGEMPDLRDVLSVDGGSFDALRETTDAPPECTREPGDLAALLYTSGTTGKPKGAMLTHGNVYANAAQAGELLPLTAGDRLGMILPLFHANAQIATFAVPLMTGCEVVMWERFAASTFWETVDELRPVSFSAVPTILSALLHAAGEDETPRETSLRYVICGAAPLSLELLEAFQNRFGLRIMEGYGLTESTCVSSLTPYYGKQKVGSIGLPVRGQEMEIRRPDGTRAERGERGEIMLRGPNIMAGYLHNEEATRQTIEPDGWMHTGDVGIQDEDGYFFIVDRTKDMIIRGGENIYPREIEEVLYEHPGVLECAVIGIPDPHRGEEVMAVVTPKPDVEVDADEVKAFLAERLTKFKVPKFVELHGELPKTPTGKISKGPLREQYAQPVASS
ncbi:class I adenylate-forming enzyme family protein [Conexibacter sp. SYSU D00693]|uniref:class I adenylate-forming enzyme family protein n=1 Tax=Conexibacter sp. SYSU D00693 TaxID=2812560 RepID=UPI00196B67B8|nr:long-chain-fatty-acid--CoA ligase [Conexibacter sp. SYSU D00693]